MAVTYISEVSVTPDAVNNLGAVFISCVIRDATDTVLSSANTATAIVTRSDGTALTNSPVSLSASGGKYTGTLVLTGQAQVGILTVQISNSNSTGSVVVVKSKAYHIRVVDDINSLVG